MKRAGSPAEELFALQLDEVGIAYAREHIFHKPRRWRFDFAFIEHGVAIEIEGGGFSRPVSCPYCKRKIFRTTKSGTRVPVYEGGRHTTGAGHREDCAKYNQAAMDGWVVLHYLPEDVRKRKALDELLSLIRKEKVNERD